MDTYNLHRAGITFQFLLLTQDENPSQGLNWFDACDVATQHVVWACGRHFVGRRLVDIEAPVTGTEIAVAGHHPQTFRVHFAVWENVTSYGERAPQSSDGLLYYRVVGARFPVSHATKRVVPPTIMLLSAPSCWMFS